MEFLIPLLSVALLVALLLVGFVLKKTGKISDPGPMTNIIIFVAQPAIVFNAIARAEFTWQNFSNLAISVGVTLVAMSVMLGLGMLTFSKEDVHRRLSSYCMAFGNIALMGMPVVRLLFPDNFTQMSLFVAGNVIAFNILQWTLGAWVLSGSREFVKPKKALLNPPMIATLLALPLFFFVNRYNAAGEYILYMTGPDALFTDHLLRIFYTLVNFLADFATAAALFVIGIRLAEMKAKDLVDTPKAYVVTFFRLAIAPLVMFLLVWWLPVDDYLKIALIIVTGMPVAATALLFCEYFQQDKHYCVKTVLVSTFISILTIPILMVIFG